MQGRAGIAGLGPSWLKDNLIGRLVVAASDRIRTHHQEFSRVRFGDGVLLFATYSTVRTTCRDLARKTREGGRQEAEKIIVASKNACQSLIN